MLAQQDNDTQVLDQMRKINERMYMLERKMDVLADLLKGKQTENKPAPKVQQVSAPSKPLNPMDLYAEESNQHQHSRQHQHNHQYQHNIQRHQPQQNHQKHERPMYEAVCADCRQECSIPFKPTGDRPVYCKDCFSKRKNPNAFKSNAEEKPQAVSQPQLVAVREEVKTNKAKPSAAKKPSAAAKTKKKPVTAKKSAPKKAPAKKAKRK